MVTICESKKMTTICERVAQVSCPAITLFTEADAGFLYSLRVILLYVCEGLLLL